MSKLSRVLLIIALLTIVGCIETKDEFTINPDGSGKVTLEITSPMNLQAGFQAMAAGAPPEMGGGKPSDPNAQLRNNVREILSKSSGVDAWNDVSYKTTDDGKMYFKGTAYFPDINNLSIDSPNIGSGTIRLTRNESGEITIEIKSQEQPKAIGAAKTPPLVPAAPEEKLDELVQQVKMQYQQAKPMMQGMFSTLKSEVILHLPGQINEVSNFERVDDSTVRLSFDGSKLMGIMDRRMQDDAWLKEQIREGKDPVAAGSNELETNELLFGQRAPIRVVVTGAAEPLFDYSTEVAAAKANYQSILSQLGPEEKVAVKAPEEAKLPSEEEAAEITSPPQGVLRTAPEEETGMKVEVGGVRLVRLSDYARGIMPLGQRDGYTLSLIAQLPVPVIKVPTGKVEKAITDTGKDLLPKDQWDRRIKFPVLANDNKTVVFDVEMLLPDEDAKGLEEVSGVLEYLTASGSRKVDLGVIALEVGAKGADYGAAISSIEADPWQKNATVLGLSLDLPSEAIKSVDFYADSGDRLDINQREYGSIGSTTILKFSVRGQLPQEARVVVNIFDEVKKDQVPFRIRNISLTGQPH